MNKPMKYTAVAAGISLLVIGAVAAAFIASLVEQDVFSPEGDFYDDSI